MATTTPRVEVVMKANKTCYLSNDPTFIIQLRTSLCDSQERITFLKDGYAGIEGYQPLISDQVLQCFDTETGEQVSVVHQGTQPVLLEGSTCIQFTTSEKLGSYGVPFVTSSLKPDRKYKLRFKPSRPISHWPATEDATESSIQDSEDIESDGPKPPRSTIPWDVVGGNDTIIFETRTSPTPTPKVTVSVSTPPTYSLSESFKFSITWSTDAPPFTARAHRAWDTSNDTDVEILNASTRKRIFPDIDVCWEEDDPKRDEFLRLDGSYTEHREVGFNDPRYEACFEGIELNVGEEYILRPAVDNKAWWWTEDTIDELFAYLESGSNLGLAGVEYITFECRNEVRFKVVE
jgi:hypothetical protein